jgi:NADPH-dependent ferric siderophore reductase
MREELQVQRVRHPLVLRQAQVVAIMPRGNSLIQITFRSPELVGFISSGFDDHVKVFFPYSGEHLPQMPQLSASGELVKTPQARPVIARDYTPRRFDPVRGELVIEFVLHGAGPGTQWAAHARIGQTLGFGGPRGSMVIPLDFDWHWLIGDDSALPAISRRLEQLPADRQVCVMLMRSHAEDTLVLPGAPTVSYQHFSGNEHSTPDSALLQLLATRAIPEGDGFVWVAGELATVRAIRQTLLARGIDKRQIRAASYWQRGHMATHQNIDD